MVISILKVQEFVMLYTSYAWGKRLCCFNNLSFHRHFTASLKPIYSRCISSQKLPSTSRCFMANGTRRACVNASLVLGLFVLHLVCSFVVSHITLKPSKQPKITTPTLPHQTVSNRGGKIKGKNIDKKMQFSYVVKLAGSKEKVFRDVFL